MSTHVAPEVNGKQTSWHWDQLTKATKSRMKLLAVRPRPTTQVPTETSLSRLHGHAIFNSEWSSCRNRKWSRQVKRNSRTFAGACHLSIINFCDSFSDHHLDLSWWTMIIHLKCRLSCHFGKILPSQVHKGAVRSRDVIHLNRTTFQMPAFQFLLVQHCWWFLTRSIGREGNTTKSPLTSKWMTRPVVGLLQTCGTPIPTLKGMARPGGHVI